MQIWLMHIRKGWCDYGLFFFWSDYEIEQYYEEGIHPCSGCADFVDDECVSFGGCMSGERIEND